MNDESFVKRENLRKILAEKYLESKRLIRDVRDIFPVSKVSDSWVARESLSHFDLIELVQSFVEFIHERTNEWTPEVVRWFIIAAKWSLKTLSKQSCESEFLCVCLTINYSFQLKMQFKDDVSFYLRLYCNELQFLIDFITSAGNEMVTIISLKCYAICGKPREFTRVLRWK